MSGSSSPQRGGGSYATDTAGAASTTRALSEEHDPEFKAAIAASLREFEEEEKKRPRSELSGDHPQNRPGLPGRNSIQTTKEEPVANLIDLSSDDEPQGVPALRRVQSDKEAPNEVRRTSTSSSMGKAAPPPPKKPSALRSPSSDSPHTTSSTPMASSKVAPPPPKPRRPSSTIRMVGQPSPLSQHNDAPTSPPSNRPAPP